MAATPSRLTQPASSSTSRLRKRVPTGRPSTSSSHLRGGTQTLTSTPETKLNHGIGTWGPGDPSDQGLEQPFGHGPFTFEFKGSENTPPKWLRRMSTLSSLRAGSPIHTPRPDSPSVSYSNGSTAPILPNCADSIPSTSRNRLVKRSSSQKLLSGNNALHSTLRRPATSHQRSATLQQHLQHDETPSRQSLAASSHLPYGIASGDDPSEKELEIWVPTFHAHSHGAVKDVPLRKRGTNSGASRNEAIKTIVPDMTEVATLLLATSLSPGSSNEAVNSRSSNISRLSRPFTPMGLHKSDITETVSSRPDDDATADLHSRHSFSLSDMFPSPSPSTWKMPRTRSLRRSKPLVRDSGSRRVVSAPQPGNSSKVTGYVKSQSSLGRDIATRDGAGVSGNPSEGLPDPSDFHLRGSSSPLPPLNRLSAFEIDLPIAIPSYPSTPQPENPGSSPRVPSPHSSYSVSFPIGQTIPKARGHRFSSAPSEPGSTLLGSDNDNSRLMSGDEDDNESRSETVYDSTRTGATGSSHSGIRRPPIDTIFDESPPPELPSKNKLFELQDLTRDKGSFLLPKQRSHDFIGKHQDVLTPIQAGVPCKEEASPTRMHDTDEIFLPPEVVSSSPLAPREFKSHDEGLRNSDPDQEEEFWTFENAEISSAEAVHIRNVSLNGSSNPLMTLPQHSESFQTRDSPPLVRASDQVSKSNIFEWSEQPLTEKDSSPGDSPRPRTVHGRRGTDMRGVHVHGRRGPSALHLRSQSVPVQKDMANRRSHNNPSNLDSWILGNKGPSEDWDGDFEFEEAPRTGKQAPSINDQMRPSLSSGMLVPRNILERQASVHGQFGQVKELALLVEDLKRLQQQAAGQGIMEGQSAELWKEAEGIINLATLDDEEREIFPPRSPHSPNFEFDIFDEDSPSMRSRRRSGISPPKEEPLSLIEDSAGSQPSSRPSQELSGLETPPPSSSRPRKESSAKAKSVLETIHQQRSHYDAALLDAPFAQKKLPFDTTSLKDLVTRAGVVTRALKEIVRRADNGSETPEPRPSTPRDPPYITQMFQRPPISPTLSRSPRVAHSPKSPNSQRSGTFIGANITTNDNDINGHMKMMTVV